MIIIITKHTPECTKLHCSKKKSGEHVPEPLGCMYVLKRIKCIIIKLLYTFLFYISLDILTISRFSGEARKRYFVTCTLFPLLWYEIKDVPIYRSKGFKFRTFISLHLLFIEKNTKCTLKLQNYYIKIIC